MKVIEESKIVERELSELLAKRYTELVEQIAERFGEGWDSFFDQGMNARIEFISKNRGLMVWDSSTTFTEVNWKALGRDAIAKLADNIIAAFGRRERVIADKMRRDKNLIRQLCDTPKN